MHGPIGTPTWRPATQLVRGGVDRSSHMETSEALYLTSGYVYASAEEAAQAFKGEKDRYIYSRYGNPTVTTFEQRLALLEGARLCMATSSGMAAVFASLLCMLNAGGRVVASRALFGSCHFIITELLPRWGVETVLVDGTDMDQWAAALATPCDAVFLESPSNPTLEIIDIRAVCELAHKAGARVVVDNVFATPVLQKPLALGADIVVYSTTKHIDGQGRTLGGAILSDDEAYFTDHLVPFLRHTGPAMSPFNAWTLLKGLETVALRVERHCANALTIAGYLSRHADVEAVLYPGLDSHPQHALAMAQMDSGGSIVSFDIGGGRDKAFRLLNALTIVDISNNLGDAKSLITHPATTTHQRLSADERSQMGIGDGLVRLSVGLEDPLDLIEDVDRAIRGAAAAG